MSWYTDPELFIYYWNPSYGYGIGRINKKCNVPLIHGDITYEEGQLNFSKHLSVSFLGNNESDYAALKSILARNADVISFDNVMYVNCQGLVVYCSYKQFASGTWSRVDYVAELNSVFYCLPGIANSCGTVILAEKQAVEKKYSDSVTENSVLKDKLKEQLNREEALEKQLFDLTAKIKECLCAGGGSANMQPWISGDTIPSHWVPFEELDVLNFSKNTPLAIMEGPSKPKFVEDVTTNVQVGHFYRGTFIVAVNVAELTPDSEKARFNPEFWGLYKNGGVSYAARKPLKSEM